MWLFVMFDLPVITKREKKDASLFRKKLLGLGFEMSQFSVYSRYCYSTERANTIASNVERILPPGGKVDVLTVTDKQFSNMRRFYGKKPIKTISQPRQLQLF